MTDVSSQNRNVIIAVLALLASAVVVYAGTFQSMLSIWLGSNTYLHGILILPLSIYLVWRERQTWMTLDFSRSVFGLVFLVCAVSAWLLGSLVSVQVVSQFAFVAILVGIVWSILGTKVVRVLHFPLLFAFFAVPFGEFLIPKLMDWTADITVLALQLTGVPVFREGNFFSLPSGNFHVIEACSGVRFLIVTIVLGVYFAHENFRSWAKKGLFLLAAILVVIVANWVRAYFVVLVANATNMKVGSGQSHIYMGWVIFLVVIVTLFWAGRKFGDDIDPSPTQSIPRANAQANFTTKGRLGRDVIIVCLVVISLATGPLVLGRAHEQVTTHLLGTRPTLPAPRADWSGPQSLRLGYAPKFAGAAHAIAGRYQRMGDSVEFHSFVYVKQGQGAEIVGWENQLFNKNQWRSLRKRTLHLTELDGQELSIHEEVIKSSKQVLRVWRWYDIGGHSGSDPRWVKWQQAWNAIRAKNWGDAAMVVVEEIDDSEVMTESDRLKEFVSSHIWSIQQCLGREPVVEMGACVPVESLGKL